ncbi:MAG: C39 family peptidase [Pseudomonadota bacterium]
MESRFALDILSQPDDTTCGPTCLHAVYSYYGDDIALTQVVAEAHPLEGGGTLEVLLACHALRRGYRATIYTYNLQVFDPTWFDNPDIDLRAKLKQQIKVKTSKRLKVATKAYLEFLALGGKLRFHDLTTALLRKYLKQDKPILCGLSSTYLYHCAREFGPALDPDDIRGVATGHFVILCGYDLHNRHVLVADPLKRNSSGKGQVYEVSIDRLVGSILLGILTYDANLLIIEPPSSAGKEEK